MIFRHQNSKKFYHLNKVNTNRSYIQKRRRFSQTEIHRLQDNNAKRRKIYSRKWKYNQLYFSNKNLNRSRINALYSTELTRHSNSKKIEEKAHIIKESVP